MSEIDLAQYRNRSLPEIRKKRPNEEVVKLNFHIETEPTFNDEGALIAPPHWELLQGDEKLGWGPIESAKAMWRFFCILQIATQLLPPEIIEDNLRAMHMAVAAQHGGTPDVKAN